MMFRTSASQCRAISKILQASNLSTRKLPSVSTAARQASGTCVLIGGGSLTVATVGAIWYMRGSSNSTNLYGKGVVFKFDAKPETFSPLYLPEPSRNTAAANAGDYRLYVGGGSINLAFGNFLKKEQGLQYDGKKCDTYADLHRSLLDASRSTGSLVAAADVPDAKQLLPDLRLAASFGLVGQSYENDMPGLSGAVGSVFIDVFDASAHPVHEKNVAMLYVVGPKGEECTGPSGEGSGPHLAKQDFLDSVQLLGRRAVEAVADYNGRWAGSTVSGQELPKIEEIRWCLVSGGVYRHGQASKLDVAKATLQGMSAVANASLTVTFTYDENVFEEAVKSKL